MMSRRLSGYAFIVLAAICWGLLGPVARLALSEGVAPLEIAFWRAVLGGALFAVHVAGRRAAGIHRARLPSLRDGLAIGSFGLVGVGLFYASYQLAVDQGGATLAAVLLYTAPGWVAVIGALFLGEPFTPRKGIALALTLGGVAAIAAAGSAQVLLTGAGIAWGLVAGLTYALYYPFGKVYFSRYTPAVVFAAALPVGAVPLALMVDLSDKTPAAWTAILAIVVVSTYGAYLAYGAGLQRIEASRASIVATLEPVVAAVAAWIWWNERLGPWGYAGAVLIVGATLLAILARTQPTAAPQEAS